MEISKSSRMYRRNLLICFDAFGTLFKPRRPVEQQYAEVARSFGLRGFSDEDVKASFRTAFKNEAKQNPNFGKANGMNAEKWWKNIITNTFQPLVDPKQQVPSDLVHKLLWRFWSDQGYVLCPGVQSVLRNLRHHYKTTNGRLVVGVITNSDDRVPDILSSLGVSVGSLRYGVKPEERSPAEAEIDVDFAVMSYDVGSEKPDRRIFEAAEEMLTLASKGTDVDDVESWQKVYVGDEYEKDVGGAIGAGWSAILVDANSAGKYNDVQWLEDQPVGRFQDMFASSKAVGFSSLERFAEWLPKSSNL